MRKLLWILALMLVVFLAACSQAYQSGKATSSLDVEPSNSAGDRQDATNTIIEAVQRDVIPYLLSQKQYLQRPTLIISGSITGIADNVGRIDGVTQAIRKRIVIELLKHPGINIIQRHRLPNIEGRGAAPRLECKKFAQPEYFLILDTQFSGTRMNVDMILQDLERGNAAVSGFSHSFSFEANAEMVRLSNQKKWDEYLQGTKHFSIAKGDKDAVAAYLAYDLLCALKNTYIPKNFALFVDETQELEAYDKEIVAFTKKYLNKYGLSTIATKPKATHILEFESVSSSGISVLWASIVEKMSGRTIPRSTTNVYYQKEQDPLTLEVINLPDNYFCLRISSATALEAIRFQVLDGGVTIFPNPYCPSKGEFFRKEGDSVVLDFRRAGSFLIGCQDSIYKFSADGSGLVEASFLVNGKLYSLKRRYK